ncbi:MAG: hypothetical protein HYV42_01940 [Candidatus Magasanikbacteria bacterium]|nr:hypothetical protein [Candidatus Magasanikbacteria bacterium]
MKKIIKITDWWNPKLNYFGTAGIVLFTLYFFYLNSLSPTFGSGNSRCQYLSGLFHQSLEASSIFLAIFVIITGIINIYLFSKKRSYTKIFLTLIIVPIITTLMIDQFGIVGLGCWMQAW